MEQRSHQGGQGARRLARREAGSRSGRKVNGSRLGCQRYREDKQRRDALRHMVEPIVEEGGGGRRWA